MNSESSGGSNSHDDSATDDTGRSVICNTSTRPPRGVCTVILKGGGNVEDEGEYLQLGVDNRLQGAYILVARLVGLRPSDVRLFYRGDLLHPSDTPFSKGFIGTEVVHVFEKVKDS